MNDEHGREVLRALVGSVTLRTIPGLARAMEDLIRDGIIRPGTKLPTIREVADELGMSRASVGHAWQELASLGLVESRRRGGTVVLEERIPPHAHRFESMIRTTARSAIDLGNIGWRDLAGPPLEEAFGYALKHPRMNLTMPEAIMPELVEAVRPFWPSDCGDFLAMHGGTDVLDAALTALVRPGDRVIVEAPTLPRVFDILKSLRAVPIPVAYGPRGPDLGQLERAMHSEPAAFVFQPAGALPSGRSVTAEWREGATEVLRGSTPIIELSQAPLLNVPLHSLAAALPSQVLHVQAFAFFFGNDMRLAVAGGNSELVNTLAMRLSFSSRYVSRIMQLALAFLLTDPGSLEFIDKLKLEIRSRHATFAKLLQEHGLEVEVEAPPYLWVKVPDETSVCANLSSHGISVYPGAFFRSDGGSMHDPRISINAGAIGEGIEAVTERIAEACMPMRLGRTLR